MRQSQKILKNIASLTAGEAVSKGIIFVYNAYLARVITPEGFGIFGFATAYIMYFLLFVNLGFNTVGAREIAKSPSNTSKYVNSIISVRCILAIIAYAILFFTVLALDKPVLVKYIIWISGINLFSNAILLDWVFHGNEKMEYLSLRQIITNLLNLIGIILLVHSKADIVIAAIVIAASTFINSVWMLLLYIKLYGKIKLNINIPFYKEMLKSSIPIAFSNFFIIILNYFNMFLLGIFRTDEETGLYNAAFKILALTIVPTVILQNSFFPLISRSETLEDRQKVMKKFFLLIFIFGTIVTAGFFTYSDYIVLTVFGNEYSHSSELMRILMFTSFIVYINVATTVPLIGWKKEKLVMYSIITGGVINIILNFALIPDYGAKGAVIATVISEGVVAVGLSYHFYRIIHKLYFLDSLKLILFSLLSCFIGYLMMKNGFHPLLSGSVTIVTFLIFIFLFRTITLPEIKEYFKK